ncbi:hypothetical protein PC114_g28504 [Phytophthora cactorum]|uniref:Uncharacterized protein n=1 Tax=Phytophthora cactorum TaxID=29920 RepID=A0A8T1A687_9STRA|nr:hypothetical protein PC114_g28504 [Phytophthora cactorum]KAG2871103.1 hypothetical protein PC117_g28333 [Phytophthora cactorum]
MVVTVKSLQSDAPGAQPYMSACTFADKVSFSNVSDTSTVIDVSISSSVKLTVASIET